MKFQSEQFSKAQRGVALVITLIMLSVITFLTIAFLAVSRRDRASVTTSLNQTDSHLMADTALARFQSELTARMMASGTLQSYDLMLTRNYINPTGYVDRGNIIDTNNVNYDFRNADGQPLNNDDRIHNIANLFFDPRPPVYVKTNVAGTPLDFRFYLDYNRNRRFETNGPQPIVIDEAGNILVDGNNQPVLRNFLGESEWIGVLQNPEYPHSPTNRFVGRYLYLALPVSRTLDLNFIHNYSKSLIGMPPQIGAANGDGFLRNQGAGSHEINLAAFLRDLNTNMYPDVPTLSYEYFPTTANPNRGAAFNDAVSFLSYRYNANPLGRDVRNLQSVANLFPGNGTTAFSGATAFGRDLIDNYSTRPILNYPFHNTTDPDRFPADLTTQPWAGSKNPQQYFEPQELFDTNKFAPNVTPNFATRLQSIVSSNNSYDRYTFSRLLEQIGTGSEPEVRGKININYVNDPAQNTVATNFVEWKPYDFFTNVVERLIKDNLRHPNNADGSVNTNIFYMFNTNDVANLVRPQFSITNIQIFPTNEYTAQLHRLLQVAANIYDATTSNKYPTLYRPQFYGSMVEAYITNFAVETNSVFLANALTNAVQDKTNITNPDGLVWGIPVVMGAKKGFPSFNEFMLQTSLQVSRNLQITKRTTNEVVEVRASMTNVNEMLTLGISNVFALEAWNSYIQPYTNKFRIILTNLLTMSLTNETGAVIWPAVGGATNYGISVKSNLNIWPSALTGSNAFILPIPTNINPIAGFPSNVFQFLPNSIFFVDQNPKFNPFATNYPRSGGYPNPTWGLQMTNRLIYALVDSSQLQGRIIDFVNLDNMTARIDLMPALLGDNLTPLPVGVGTGDNVNLVRQLWDPNRLGGAAIGNNSVITRGIRAQINYSMGDPGVLDDADWGNYGGLPANKLKSIAEFAKFMGSDVRISGYENLRTPTNLVWQTPFNPTRKLDQTISWQVNDPLVHYMSEDLLDRTNLTSIMARVPPNGPPVVPNNLHKINKRYRPWGRPYGEPGTGPLTQGAEADGDFAYDLRVKDPRIRWSDDWDFPTNKFASIGELGKVHRGTPWQTIYLKAATITNRLGAADNRSPEEIGLNWADWAGHIESHATNDWKLLDFFTTSANDNAARGLLSVNQTNQAAWSAVLSGVVALTNWMNDAQAKASENQPGQTNSFQSVVIQPGLAISNIVSDINLVRATRPNGVFSSLGEILSVPKLSVFYSDANNFVDSSPFLNVTNYNFDATGTNKVLELASNGKPKNQEQRFYGVTDEAYERIPRQIASLLKLGEPRFVVYCYGQSLKPAPNSIVLSAPFGSGLFNLCTNYQITGEVVTRTVMRVEGNPDAQHPKTIVESYNILPAEE